MKPEKEYVNIFKQLGDAVNKNQKNLLPQMINNLFQEEKSPTNDILDVLCFIVFH